MTKHLANLKHLWPSAEPVSAAAPTEIAVPAAKRKQRKARKQHAKVPVFVTEATFLRDLIAVLTADRNEHMRFVTGPMIEEHRVLSRWAQPVVLQQQSTVFVSATAQSAADVLIAIIEEGAQLHCIAHSHPGGGPDATTPSGTDIACLGKLQASGSPAIGCIVTRDGHVRFFTTTKKLKVLVQGTGVTEVSQNVFHIAPHD